MVETPCGDWIPEMGLDISSPKLRPWCHIPTGEIVQNNLHFSKAYCYRTATISTRCRPSTHVTTPAHTPQPQLKIKMRTAALLSMMAPAVWGQEDSLRDRVLPVMGRDFSVWPQPLTFDYDPSSRTSARLVPSNFDFTVTLASEDITASCGAEDSTELSLGIEQSNMGSATIALQHLESGIYL